MRITPFTLTLHTFFQLPSAFWCGVRVKTQEANRCETTVKHRWINQNPFQSMYFAVQAMAAEMSTGVLLIAKIRACGQPVSMLVANTTAHYGKKARGRLVFTCNDGHLFDQALAHTLATGEGASVWIESAGRDEVGDVVSSFRFEWTVRRKPQQGADQAG